MRVQNKFLKCLRHVGERGVTMPWMRVDDRSTGLLDPDLRRGVVWLHILTLRWETREMNEIETKVRFNFSSSLVASFLLRRPLATF
jgi:hypothetical protein